MNSRRSPVLPVWLCLAVALSLPAAGDPEKIRYEAGTDRLWVQVQGEPFVDVMSSVAEATGSNITLGEEDYGSISIKLQAVSLTDGLKALLDGKGYMIFRLSGGSLQVRVLSRQGAGQHGLDGGKPPPADPGGRAFSPLEEAASAGTQQGGMPQIPGQEELEKTLEELKEAYERAQKRLGSGIETPSVEGVGQLPGADPRQLFENMKALENDR